tara:strand:+ start:97 stop:405 length:309 start_codon:yes stop_codon:yes gene_type:complete
VRVKIVPENLKLNITSKIMNTKIIKQKLENYFPKNDLIEVVDINNTGDHFSIIIVSNKFNNKSLIDRHKIIYKIFSEEITKEIHALQIKTYTHSEWKNNNNQ